MNKWIAIIWAGFTTIPFVYMAYFITKTMSRMDNTSFEADKAEFDFLFRLHMLDMLLIFALMATYIIYLFKTNYVPQEKKALWAVVLFMGNMFSMPIFWFFYVWSPLLQKGEFDSQTGT